MPLATSRARQARSSSTRICSKAMAPPFYLLGILSLPVQVQHFWPLATERKHMKEIGSLKKIPKEHNSPRQTLSLPILIKGIYMYRRHDLPLIWVALLSIPRPTSCGLSCFWSQYATSKHLGRGMLSSLPTASGEYVFWEGARENFIPSAL